MQKLQCDLCNSVDIIKNDEGFYQCQHCGCKYTLAQAQSMLSGTVEIVKGNAERERLLANAKTEMKLGEYDRAVQIISQTALEYPGEYRVWLTMLEIGLLVIEKRRSYILAIFLFAGIGSFR